MFESEIVISLHRVDSLAKIEVFEARFSCLTHSVIITNLL